MQHKLVRVKILANKTISPQLQLNQFSTVQKLTHWAADSFALKKIEKNIFPCRQNIDSRHGVHGVHLGETFETSLGETSQLWIAHDGNRLAWLAKVSHLIFLTECGSQLLPLKWDQFQHHRFNISDIPGNFPPPKPSFFHLTLWYLFLFLVFW